MKGLRWPHGSRKKVAERYGRASVSYRTELFHRLAGEAEEKGLTAEEAKARVREARKATAGLSVWKNRKRFEEVVDWLGEFDSARTLIEEWPAMGRFCWDGDYHLVGGGVRVAGGPPPEWMRGWLPLVSEWEKGRRGEEVGWVGMGAVAKMVNEVWVKGVREEVEKRSAFLRYLRRNDK